MNWDSEHIRIAKNAAWTSAKIGNSTEAEYYTQVEPGNPSGNKNLKRLIHKDGNGRVVFVINYEWDADDDFVRDYSAQSGESDTGNTFDPGSITPEMPVYRF